MERMAFKEEKILSHFKNHVGKEGIHLYHIEYLRRRYSLPMDGKRGNHFIMKKEGGDTE